MKNRFVGLNLELDRKALSVVEQLHFSNGTFLRHPVRNRTCTIIKMLMTHYLLLNRTRVHCVSLKAILRDGPWDDVTLPCKPFANEVGLALPRQERHSEDRTSNALISMSKARCLSFLVPMIGVLIMTLSLEVGAQSTVDDDASCQSSTLDEAVIHLITDVKKGFADVKNVCGSRQQTCSVIDSSGLCEYLARFCVRLCVLCVAEHWSGA